MRKCPTGEDFGGEFEGRVTSEGHGEARRFTPGGVCAPGICSPNCASHRGFGTFEGIVCRDIRHWRMIHGASHEYLSGALSLAACGRDPGPKSRGRPDSAGNVKKADLLRMRVVERMNRLGGRLQQDRAALFRKIRLSFRR